MRFTQLVGNCLLSLTSLASAAAVPAIPEHSLQERQTKDSACTNGPFTRACWKDGFSIATDFDQKFPTTGKTVYHDLTITNSTCNPDGNGDRLCLLINGQYPGPAITAAWGDRLEITVHNKMQDNGTSMHWHGVRQYNSVGYDGVNGITECPIAPGDSKTYKFQATQFGTSWYHAHYSSQYGDGIVGPIVFDGPASANYDLDLGPYMVNDWYYRTAYQIDALTLQALQNRGPGPGGDNILINGTNKNAAGGGKYNAVTIKKGKKYRLRLINISVDNNIRVSLDNHPMQVMTSDFIPIKPYTTEWVLLAIGQRYDVVINANQTAGNYWFRANVARDCLSSNSFNAKAIWTYDTVTAGTPASSAYSEPNVCTEPTNLAPYWKQAVPPGPFVNQPMNVNLTKAKLEPNGDTMVVWAINTSSINVHWETPTLKYLMDRNTNYPTELNVVPTTSDGKWNYWLIQSVQGTAPVPHPMHLHGHDYFVIGQGGGVYDPSSAVLNWDTPPRRDTATLPGGGWMAIAFPSNNPGAWLLHCHIAWHISEGLGMQFVESPDKIQYPPASEFSQTCNNWNSYYKNAFWKKHDSGL
ncbi:hypothetical protein Q7P36_006988 [Cladosporium allicinum]